MPATQTVTGDDIEIQIFFPVGPPDARHLADLISKLYHLDPARPDQTLSKDLGRLRSIAAEEQTGQLVAVGDRKALDHVHQLVARLAIAAEPTTQSKVYALKHWRAASAAAMLNQLLKIKGAPAPLRRELEFNAVADDQTNTLAIIASENLLKLADSFIEAIDKDTAPPQEVKTFTLRSASASMAERFLNAVFAADPASSKDSGAQRPRAIADERSGCVIVTGDSDAIKVAVGIISQLEGISSGPGIDDVRIYRLRHSDARKDAVLLKELFNIKGFVQAPGDALPDRASEWLWNVVADEQSNALMVASSTRITNTLKELIEELDKPLPATQPAEK